MYQLADLDDDSLYEGFNKIAERGRLVTAVQLAYIAEVDRRHMYLREGFESMKACCMRKFDLSEDRAKKWIHIARIALEFPVLFPALADGRLCISAARLIAPRLTRGNVDELIAEAAHLTVQEVELLLAKYFPRAGGEISTQTVVARQSESDSGATWHPSPVRNIGQRRTKIAPISHEWFEFKGTFPAEMHTRLRYAQQLLGHAVPGGNLIEVLDRALKALIRDLERKKFGVGSKRGKAIVRGIPARVKLAVFQRDGGTSSSTT